METGWFGTYANGTDSQIVPLEKQPFYEFDYIGIRFVCSCVSCVRSVCGGACAIVCVCAVVW